MTENDYTSNTTLADIAAIMIGANSFVITTHGKPDGDALGAVLSLGRALEAIGKTVERWIIPPLPHALRGIVDEGVKLHFHGDEHAPMPTIEPDRVIVVDTGAWSQLDALRSWIEPRREKTIVIDHHLHGDDVGAKLFVDTSAAAVCEVIARLIDELGVEIDRVIAQTLFVGVASDTGWFRFSNTTAATHDLAARLMRAGADHAAIYRVTEQGERPEKLELMKRALQSLQLVAGGSAAVMTLTYEDFQQVGALPEDTERFVDLPQAVAGIETVVLISEPRKGATRMSFRSKPSATAINVNELAQRFGGGGHARAAGAKMDGPIDQVRQAVIEALEAASR
ncbi:MAG: hypothetical protein GC159_23220 [Phycisphaera sp.]|nr:hypothetical protein [Phycisphaera sp.]